MSVSDPHCGTCHTLKRGDKTVVIKHGFPKALQHHYPLPSLEASGIPVYRGNYDYEGTRYRGILKIDLEPQPTLVAQGVREITFPDGFDDHLENPKPAGWVDYGKLTIPTKKVPAPAKTTRAPRPLPAFGAVSATADYLDSIEVGDPTNLESITFYLLNGWFGTDGLSTCYAGTERRGRIDVVLEDWQLRIEPRGDIAPNDVHKHQRKSGVSTVTHVGRIRRNDGGKFDASDATDVLKIIESLAGFALGRATAVILPVGYRDNKATWALYKCNRIIARPIGGTPFLDRAHTSAQMTELFRTGYATSKTPSRWEVFESALGYHYTAEHGATVNMKVLLPVSALQLLSYAYLVQELPAKDPNHLSNKQWKDLQTVDQLRRVLTAAGIDTTAPKHLTRLAKVQADITHTSLPTPDALDCVVRLRNMVAHPKQKLAKKWTIEEWAETGFAATTMFNVAMLWWLNYDERYLGKSSEQRGYGDSIHVPWHKPEL